MAEDIKIIWISDQMECDIGIGTGDLELDGGLTTAVIMSLFTDRRARADDLLDDPDQPRGWWGDQTNTKNPDDEIGSRLWLLERAKTTTENLKLAKIYIEEALQWMIDDEVAKKIDVTVERSGPNMDRLCFSAAIYKSDGTGVTYKFDDVWNTQLSA